MFWQRIAENQRRTRLLFAAFFALGAAVAWAAFVILGDWIAPAVIAGGVGLYSLVTAKLGQRLVMAFMGARPATPEEHQTLANIVDEMAIAAQIPRPDCRVIDDEAPNAFATGTPGKGAVCVTTGLLAMLDRDELTGVVAHEVAHIASHDTRVMTVAYMLAGIVAALCDIGLRMRFWGGVGRSRRRNEKGAGLALALAVLIMILAPLVGRLLAMAVSRRREYLADAEAVRLTRNPHGLAGALRKLAGAPHELRRASTANCHLFIVNPLRGEKLDAWFSTHPPIQERIALLENM